MSRDLVLDVIARKSSKDLSTLADEFDRLAKRTDDAGNKMHRMGTFSQFLDTELAKTKVHVKELGEEFERTGNKDVFAKLRGAQANVKSLERIKADLSKALESGVKDAIPVVESTLLEAGNAANKGFWGTFSSLPPQAQAAIAAGIAAAIAAGSAYIGSVLGGALLAGVAGVGIGAAIAAQISDPSVANALGSLKTDLGDTFKDVTSAFGPVLIRSAAAFGAIVRELAPGLKSAFETAAPFAESFLRGVGDFIRNALPGLETALVAGSKILDRMGQSSIPKLGTAVSDFFDNISKGGREGGDALDFTVNVIATVIRTLGLGIEVAEGFFGAFEDAAGLMGGLVTGNFGLLTDRIMAMGDSSNTTASSIKSVGGAAFWAASATRELSDAFDKAFGSAMNVDQAATRFASDIYGLKGALDSHSKSIDLNSAAGAHNHEVLTAAIGDAKAHRDALIAQAGGANASAAAISAANKTYEDDINKLRDMATKAGISARAFDDLAGRYDVDVVTHHTDVYSSDYQQHSRGEHAAGGSIFGGLAGMANRFSVGEQGREYLTLPAMSAPAYVTPNSTINGSANGGADQILGRIEVAVTNGVTGDVIVRELVNLGRRTNRTTFNTLIPVKTSR